MRVVLDTNVVVSAYLSQFGAPSRILEQWRLEALELLVSEPILTEYHKVLNYPRVQARHQMTASQTAEVIDGFRIVATLVEPTEGLRVVEEDPDDDKFLECAVAGGAEYIISGDAHLLALGEFRGITILPPAVFLSLLGTADVGQ